MKKISISEVIEIFLQYSIYEIKKEMEIPNINFIFLDNSIFQEFSNYQNSINFLINHSHDDCINIVIKDSHLFFKYLKDIINETVQLFYQYEDQVDLKETAQYLLRRIWLRMGIIDVNDILLFLKKQLAFVKDRTFDNMEPQKIGFYNEYDVLMKTKPCDLWDETTRGMLFTIINEKESYELPRILYDIDDNGCYIYGVQNIGGEKSKHIERRLYQLNKGITNPNVHPSKVFALLLFIQELRKKKITQIIVPSLQVLSYHYHELLSLDAKRNYEDMEMNLKNHPDDIYLQNRLIYLKNWYDHVYEKQDKISYLKTEELIYLIYRLTEHDDNLEIINDIDIQGDSIKVKIK